MYICKNCNQTYETPEKFCSNCGSPIVEENSAQAGFSPAAPIENNPYQVTHTPAPSGGTVAMGIIGFVLSLGNSITTIVSVIYSFIAIGLMSSYEQDVAVGMAIFAGICSFIAISVGVVAKILCTIARNKGMTSGLTSAGSIIGLVTAIINAVTMFLSFIACVGSL